MQQLRTRRHQRLNADAGFTLIELLMVIVILGILAVIVLYAIGSTRSDAIVSTCKTDLKSIQEAAQVVHTHEGAYPTTAAELGDPDKGGLLKAFPTNSGYTLTYPGTGGPPHVDVSGDAVKSLTDECKAK